MYRCDLPLCNISFGVCKGAIMLFFMCSAVVLLDVAYADEVFCYLYGVEGCSFFYLVANEPEGDAVGVGKVFADASNEDVVAVFVEEWHGVFLFFGAVFECESLSVAYGFSELFDADGAFCFCPYAFAVATK